MLSFVVAALLAPLLYSAGKGIAAYTEVHEASKALEWLGKKCANAQFDRYFKRSLLLVGIVLLAPLIYWCRRGKSEKITKAPSIPGHAFWPDAVGGFVIAAGSSCALAMLLVWKGYFYYQGIPSAMSVIVSSLLVAVCVALIEEWVFRGAILSLLLRSMSTKSAAVWSAVLYALVHFTQPPKGIVISSPDHWSSGFEFLWNAGLELCTAKNVAASFLGLFAVGVILAFARVATGRLWLAIGLHAGWVFVYKVFNEGCVVNGEVSQPLVVGGSLREGLLPLAVLVITMGMVMHWTKRRYDQKIISE